MINCTFFQSLHFQFDTSLKQTVQFYLTRLVFSDLLLPCTLVLQVLWCAIWKLSLLFGPHCNQSKHVEVMCQNVWSSTSADRQPAVCWSRRLAFMPLNQSFVAGRPTFQLGSLHFLVSGFPQVYFFS